MVRSKVYSNGGGNEEATVTVDEPMFVGLTVVSATTWHLAHIAADSHSGRPCNQGREFEASKVVLIIAR